MRILFIMAALVAGMYAQSCEKKLFSIVTNGDEGLPLKEIVTSVSDTCDLTVVLKDGFIETKLEKSIKYLKIKDVTLQTFLEKLLSTNNIVYELHNDTLVLSYVTTVTLKVDYVASQFSGNSTFNASSVSSSGSDDDSGSSDTGGGSSSNSNNLSSTFSFDFWTDLERNLASIINTKADDGFTAKSPVIDKNSGLVTITATQKQIERVKKYISLLNDRLHKEVVIDVKIYSVDLSSSHSTGINWSTLSLSLDESSNARIQNVFGSTSVFKGTSFNAQGLLNFLATYGNVSSVSNPKITTLNNQKAIISVGDTINYRYNTSTTDSNGVVSTSTMIESKFVGVLLDITPEIGDDGAIILRINPSISAFRDLSQLEDDDRLLPPDTTDNKLSSVVKINDGGTMIFGGLIIKKDSLNRNGIPVLKEIPIIKYLFSYKEKISNKSEMVFIITPHVVDLSKQAEPKDYGYGKLPFFEEFE